MSRPGLVLVSGGSGAIGEATCRLLHAHGWQVVIGYVNRARAQQLSDALSTDGLEVRIAPLDLSRPETVAAEVASILDVVGHVDALVLNAGWSIAGRFTDSDEADWHKTLNINFLGPVAAVHTCLPGMIAAGGGAIVGVTSEVAKVGESGHASYCAAKAALASFCKTIVREYGRQGIRANCVAPGPIDTPMIHESYPEPGHADAVIAKIINNVPLGRRGDVNDIAEAIDYLLGARYVAGQHLSVGGGVTMT